MIQLTITDDGNGYPQNEVAHDGHYGLQGMQERAALMGQRSQSQVTLAREQPYS